MATILRGKTYLAVFDTMTSLNPILIEFEASEDEAAQKHFNDRYASRLNAKLYKLIQDGEKS